jgi:hypothetical protein
MHLLFHHRQHHARVASNEHRKTISRVKKCLDSGTQLLISYFDRLPRVSTRLIHQSAAAAPIHVDHDQPRSRFALLPFDVKGSLARECVYPSQTLPAARTFISRRLHAIATGCHIANRAAKFSSLFALAGNELALWELEDVIHQRERGLLEQGAG